MRTLTKLVIAVAFMMVLGSGQVKAGTIAFDGFANTIFGDEITSNGFVTGSSDGFDFQSSGDHFHFIDASCCSGPSNGTSSLLEDRDYTITMSQTGGGSFSMSGLQVYGYLSPVDIIVTGFFNGGGTIAQTFTAVSSAGFTDEVLSGFTNLTSVTFDGSTANGFGLENIQVGAAVPEPATLTFVLSGVGLLAAFARFRKASR